MIRLSHKWLICTALLPVLLLLMGIGIAVPLAHRGQCAGQIAASSTSHGGADDYVEGLARLGIARLPSFLAAK